MASLVKTGSVCDEYQSKCVFITVHEASKPYVLPANQWHVVLYYSRSNLIGRICVVQDESSIFPLFIFILGVHWHIQPQKKTKRPFSVVPNLLRV